MTTITVTNLYDSGPGSLRQAILDANSGDTIKFASDLASGTLVLTSGELDITKNLTIIGDIDGNGTPDITISGDNASRVFLFEDSITATFDGLVMVNGNVVGAPGGAMTIGQNDAITVNHSRLSNNSASGLLGGGGAIFVSASGSLTLLNTAISHNSAGTLGGGIYADGLGTVNIVNSTLSGNIAQTDGGGAFVRDGGTLTFVNSTLSGNSADAGSGIYESFGAVNLYDSTLTGNLSNQYAAIKGSAGSLTLSNSIVAGNSALANDDIYGTTTSISFRGSNILGSPVGGSNAISGTYTQINGSDQTALETVFGAVGQNPDTSVLSGLPAKNGGPVQTVAINATGIAYNAGSDAALPPDSFDLNNNGNTGEPLPVDARGFTRRAGGTVDIGAFEEHPRGPFVVTTLADEPYDGGTFAQEAADGTGLSLREALALANASPGPHTITFAPDLTDETIQLTNGELAITGDGVTIDGDIDGNGTPDIAIDAGGYSRVFEISSNLSAVTFNGLVMTNGYVGADNGGAIAVDHTDFVTVSNSRLTHNNAGYAGVTSGGKGGAISIGSGNLTIINTTIDHNSAEVGGGGIYDNSSSVYVINSTLSGNTTGTSGVGGGVYNHLATLTLVNATLSGNAAYAGGGIENSTGTVNLYDSTLTGNLAHNTGGIETTLGDLTLSNSIVAGNYGQQHDDVSGTNNYFKGKNILGSSPAGGINTSQGTYIQIDGRDAAALETVFARVGYNPHTGVLSGVLADNGGPVRTAAINPAGIAYNAGSNAALPPDTFDLNNNIDTGEPLPVDARGFARVSGGTVDIGAFEQQQGATFIVTTLDDETYDGGTLAQETADGSGLSLREALGLANQDPTTADTITFASGLIGGSTHGVNDGVLLLTNGQLKINGNVTIEGDVNGDQTPDITIDGQDFSRDLSIAGGNVSIDGLTITGGYAFAHGGGVSLGHGGYGPANVAISHSVISNNNALYGGGISVAFGDSLQLTNSVVSGNSAYYVGGGIANVGTLALRDTTVSGNTSGYIGGGIANHYAGVLTVVNSTISNNTITNGSRGYVYYSAGAGLYNAGSATLANTTIAGNKGSYAGGGIYNSGDLTLTNATIANNSAYNGGGLYNAACGCGNATLNNSTVTGNNADQYGGGIGNAAGTVTLTNTLVAGNRAGYQGSDIATGYYGSTNYTGVNLSSQSGVGRPGTDIVQTDLAQVFADLTTIDPDGVPSSGDEFQAGTLANNGGSIETVAIKVGGNAQDTGSTADLPPDDFDLNHNADTAEALPVDARGAPRVFGAAVDIGAFEAQAPMLTNVPVSASYTEQAAPVELSPAFGNPAALTVTDVGVPPTQSVIASAVVTVSTGAIEGDLLAATTAGTGITASYDSATETLTLTGSDTLADYSEVLDSVTFSSTSDNPDNFGSSTQRVVTWSVTDVSGAISAPGTTTVSITAVNDPPTLANVPTSANYTENAAPITLASTASVSDPDNLKLTNATVKIAGGTFAGDGDVLTFSTAGTGITASYNASTETLTLSGSDTLAHYQQVLDSIAFSSTSDNPTDYGSFLSRVLTWTVNDGSASNNTNAPAFTTVAITAVNDPPSLANVATADVVTFPGQTITISPAVSVSDPDSLKLAGATVKITGGTFAGDGDVLAANVSGTSITASYNAATETLTLTGSDTLAHYQSVLDSVTFDSTSGNPTNGGNNKTRTVTWTVNDGSGSNSLSAAATTTISFQPLVKNDFDGDNKSDLLLQNDPFLGSPDVKVELLNGFAVGATGTITSPTGWTVEASGDFNNDNKADIILQANDGLPQIWLMNGTSVTSTVTLPNSGPTWHVIASADFNGDGNADILWQNNDGAADIWLMNGTSMIGAALLPYPGATWRAIGAGDVDGDGKADILWQNNDGAPAIWEMNGVNLIGGVVLPNSGPSWHVINFGDFNGDGNADILWQNTDGNADIWLLNGMSMIGAALLPFPGATWHAIGTSDFNGDGKADILWQNTDGTPAFWLMNGVNLITGILLPNPGSSWHLNDDGPIAPDQMTTGAPQASTWLSAPDAAAGALPASGILAGVGSDPSSRHLPFA